MAELHVRNLPPELHTRLRQRAVAEDRSVSAEVVAILRAVLADEPLTARRRQAIDRLRSIRRRAVLAPGTTSAEELVRDDREQAG